MTHFSNRNRPATYAQAGTGKPRQFSPKVCGKKARIVSISFEISMGENRRHRFLRSRKYFRDRCI